jgi:HlyD family secretion protein
MAIADTSAQDVALDPPSRTRRWLVAGAAVIVLGGLSAFSYPMVSRWLLAEVSVPRERLRLATVQTGDFVRDVSAQGRVVAAVSPTLFATSSGTITLLAVAGAEVEVGEELARVDSPDLDNRLKQEQATLASQQTELDRQRIQTRQAQLQSQKDIDLAEVALTAAKRELRRVEQAFETGAAAEIDLDRARDEVNSAELGHEHAIKDMQLDGERLAFEVRTRELTLERQQLLVEDLERQIDELTIRSPVNGIVGNLLVDQKAAVTKDQPVMAVVDLTAFELEVGVPESYADDLGLDMPAEIRVGTDRYDARVISISPEITDNQVMTRLRFTPSSPPGLRQNQRLTARILLENRANVLKVERGQFLDSGAGRVAYVVEDGIAYRRPISVGARSLGEVEILDGLDAGDVIISSSIESFEGAETVFITD